jgi:hypothetical protein
VADYSEFPTTPTAWQEIDQFEVEDPPPPPVRRAPDLVALVPGVFFTVVAVAVLGEAVASPGPSTSADAHSHSMVPGGLLVTSRTTRLTSGTSLVIRVETRASRS